MCDEQAKPVQLQPTVAHQKLLAAPLGRPVPPETLAGIISLAQLHEMIQDGTISRDKARRHLRALRSTDDEAFRRTMTPICRALRVDPDGPERVPMMPAMAWQRDAVEQEITRRSRHDVRDAALVRALLFT